MPKYCIAIFTFLLLIANPGLTEEHQDWSVEHWGTVTFGTRIFLDDPAHSGQKGNNFSLTFEPTIYSESAEGNSFTFTPFVMIDSVDSERTHVDIREAYYLTFGSLGESEWELRIGIDQVFWGTAESHNPVNVINQTDYVVHPNGESKLGQPMVHGTLAGDWGMLDAFILPYHRPRTFPGIKGRFRTDLPNLPIVYASSKGRNHIDLAARYSNSIGALDFGVSYFDGTSRDPRLGNEMGEFIQYYDLIKQLGLDVQVTIGSFLGKAEWVTREAITDKKSRSRTHKSVLGGEYAIYGIFESEADLTLFVEWIHDTGDKTQLPLQDDMFYAARYAFNDIMDTDITVALIDDRDFDTKTLNIEFNRRLSDTFSLTVEAFKFLEEDQSDIPSRQIVNDEYVALELSFSY